MEAWAAARKLRASAKIDFFARAVDGRQGHGAVAKECISPGELLLEIPLEACLTPLKLPDAPDFMDEQQKLMLRLLHEVLVLGERSQWKPYLDTLPRDFPTLPLWYTPAEMRLLRGTSVDSLLEGGHIANERDLEAILSWCGAHPALFPPELDLSLDDLRWAASVVASRAFDSSHAGVVLAPFADALNHSGAGPHTRMRDGGELLVFVSERKTAPGEEILNCYGEHGNSQWLLNGGFVDVGNPFEELLVTQAEVVSAALTYLSNSCLRGDSDAECGDAEGSEDDADDASVEGHVGSRLAWMQQQRAVADDYFTITSSDLLPDGMVTLLAVLCMSGSEFAAYQRRPSEQRLIDLAAEDLGEPLLQDLYGAVLQLVELVERRFGASLEEDLVALETLFPLALGGTARAAPVVAASAGGGREEPPLPAPAAAAALGPMPPPAAKRRRCGGAGAAPMDAAALAAAVTSTFGPGMRPENVRNALLLRVGQKRLLRELRQRTRECFAADSEGSEAEEPESAEEPVAEN